MDSPTPQNSATTGRDSVAKAVRRNLAPKKAAGLLRRAFSTLRHRGPQALWREFAFRFNLATHRPVWRYRADIPLKRELRAQRKNPPLPAPLVSVVCPLYNTPVKYLRQMTNSVRRQSYANWELVLADASDDAHADATKLAQGLARKDARVKYLRLEQNAGIAGNTNAGIAASGGEWITLLDHDDVLQPNALYEVVAAANTTGAELVYSDEVVLDECLKNLGEFHFKGDYGPDTLRGCNTITHLCAFTRALMERAGGAERGEYDGAQDYELILRLTEQATRIHHIPKVLYFWRRHGGSTAGGMAQKPAAAAAGAKAINAHLARLGLAGAAEPQAEHPGSYRVRYRVAGGPLVSVLIPSCDHVDDLARCLASLYGRGGWENFEVLVIENNSKDTATEAYYAQAQRQYSTLRVLRWPPEGSSATGFNFSALNNFGARHAKGEHLLLLNNDVELIGEGFIPELLCYSQRPDVGAVGAKLYYPGSRCAAVGGGETTACSPDGEHPDSIQHAGLFVGIAGTAGVSHKGHPRADGGDLFRLCTTQNVSAVTGAALMVKAALYREAGGLDEEKFAVAFNDVDFCLRLRQKGLWNVFTPFAEAYHYESKSRGSDERGPARQRFDKEAAALRAAWPGYYRDGDPFYNPHLTLKTENFAYR